MEAEKSTGVTHFAVTFVMSWDKMLDDDDLTLDVPLSPDVKEKLRVRNIKQRCISVVSTLSVKWRCYVILWCEIITFYLCTKTITISSKVNLLSRIFYSRASNYRPQHVFTGVCLSGGGCTPPGQITPQGRHPPRQTPATLSPAHSYCSRRYASYWNIFMFYFAVISL